MLRRANAREAVQLALMWEWKWAHTLAATIFVASLVELASRLSLCQTGAVTLSLADLLFVVDNVH